MFLSGLPLERGAQAPGQPADRIKYYLCLKIPVIDYAPVFSEPSAKGSKNQNPSQVIFIMQIPISVNRSAVLGAGAGSRAGRQREPGSERREGGRSGGRSSSAVQGAATRSCPSQALPAPRGLGHPLVPPGCSIPLSSSLLSQLDPLWDLSPCSAAASKLLSPWDTPIPGNVMDSRRSASLSHPSRSPCPGIGSMEATPWINAALGLLSLLSPHLSCTSQAGRRERP